MKLRLFSLFLGALMLLLAACGPAPAAAEPTPAPTAVLTPQPTPEPEPTPSPFPKSPCVELKVKFLLGSEQRYNLKLLGEKESWSLVLTDYPGSILEPGTNIFVSGTEAKDLPYDRFLEVFRAYHAEAWDGWETPAGEESFALELTFADGSWYSVTGGEEPEGFAPFLEALVREMARFAEDWCGLEPQTVQERLLNTRPTDWGDGSMNDIYVFSRVVLPLWENGAEYHAPAYLPEKHDLTPFLGDWLLDHEDMSWYRIKGMKSLKYVISKDGEGNLRLWEYRWRMREDWSEPQSMEDLLCSVYGVEGPEDLVKIIVTEGNSTRAFAADWEYRIKPKTIEDRESLDAFYDVFSRITWTGYPFQWKRQEDYPVEFPRYTYSFTPEDGDWLSDPTAWYFGERRITPVFADGTTMEYWIYYAVKGWMYKGGYSEHIEPDYPLPPEDVYTLNALFDIA